MHIAFLTPEYPHPKILHSAGIGTSIRNLVVELAKQHLTVTVFVYSQDSNEVFQENGIVIHKIAYKKYRILSWYHYRKQIQNYINNVVKATKIDVIEAPDWTGITAFMKFDCPLLIRLHGTDAYFCHLEGRKQKLKNYFFEKRALKSANYITSVSAFTAQETKKIFNIKTTIKVIHNGIDLNLFENTKDTLSFGEGQEALASWGEDILYFGSIIRKKGILELAEIFNEVIKQKPTAKLTLLGKDVIDIVENKSTLMLFMSKLSSVAKQNVIHIPHVPYKEVEMHIAKTNVIVLPSFAEAFPMTWLEAMAMGKALVTSNIGWASELMIDGETGFMENPKNHIEYASKIIQLLENEDLNLLFGRNAKKHIEAGFSQEIICGQNIEYFKSIIQVK